MINGSGVIDQEGSQELKMMWITWRAKLTKCIAGGQNGHCGQCEWAVHGRIG